jgi:IPT/TIG domain
MTVRHLAIVALSFALSVVPRLSAGVSFVQANYKTSTSATSLAVPYPSAQTAGNLNIVVVGWNDTTSVVSSITDSRGNTYQRAVGPTAGTALTQSIYFAKNIAAGSNTVTVTFNKAANYPDVRALEYSGADTANPLDVTAAAVGTGLAASSGPASTTSLNELIFGAGMTFDVFNASGSGFAKRVITNFGDIAEDATVANTGLYSATASLRASAPWVMQMATFRGQSSSTPAFTVSGISPSSGPASGGTSVKITGTGFLPGAMVTFGGVAGTNVTVANASTITATTPSHAAGTVNVLVANGIAQSGTLTNAYTYTSAPSTGGGGSIRFVQVKSAVTTSGSSVAATFTAAQTAGNLNVVAVMWGDTVRTVSSVTDSKGNAYALAVGPTKTTGLTSTIYYARNIASGSNTVTVAFNGTAAYPNVNVLEYSGLDTASPLDIGTSATGTGTTANSGSAQTTSGNELIVGAGNPSSVFTSAGSGFSSRTINTFGGIAEDKIVSNTGNYNATATLTSGTWVMQMAAFRAGTSTSAPGPTQHSVSMGWGPSPSTNVAYYKLYRGTVSGGPYSLLATNITADTYTDSTVQPGATYYYVTTTVSTAGLESVFSNQFKCTVPTP